MFPLHDVLGDAQREALSSYDDLTAALLARRGIVTSAEAETFLNPSYEAHTHDPLTLLDMSKAATRLARAIASKEPIGIWSDYDCDGIPGAVILHDFLQKVGATFVNYIPHRHLEGYGLNTTGIDKLASSGHRLLITVDLGITDVEPIAHANEQGMDVIITDHHLPGDTLPEAFAIINPNARKDEVYPFHELCGAALAWKLVCATLAVSPELRSMLPQGWEKWLLDMVGVATIADMVPLVGENRVLARYGLFVLRKSPRIGLRKLCYAMRSTQSLLTEDDVGFMIAPRVNAASRMGDAKDAFDLFTTTDESTAEVLAKKLEKLNRERKGQAGAITRAVRARLKERTTLRSVIALGDPEWRPGLLGLVANGIAEEYERPVFLWGREGGVVVKGSVRSGGPTHALELMRAAEDTFVSFGGHAASGGFTVKDEAIFSLEDRLVAAYERMVHEPLEDDVLALQADAEITLDEVTGTLLKKIELLAPFGVGNPKPVFLLRSVSAKKISRFGKNNEHVKLELVSSHGAQIAAITFFAKGDIARIADSWTEGGRVSLLAHLERDTFSRGNPVRLRLIALRAV